MDFRYPVRGVGATALDPLSEWKINRHLLSQNYNWLAVTSSTEHERTSPSSILMDSLVLAMTRTTLRHHHRSFFSFSEERREFFFWSQLNPFVESMHKITINYASRAYRLIFKSTAVEQVSATPWKKEFNRWGTENQNKCFQLRRSSDGSMAWISIQSPAINRLERTLRLGIYDSSDPRAVLGALRFFYGKKAPLEERTQAKANNMKIDVNLLWGESAQKHCRCPFGSARFQGATRCV